MQRPDESLPHADRIRALERARQERGVARAAPAADEPRGDQPTPGARARPAVPLPPALAAHVRTDGTTDDEDVEADGDTEVETGDGTEDPDAGADGPAGTDPAAGA